MLRCRIFPEHPFVSRVAVPIPQILLDTSQRVSAFLLSSYAAISMMLLVIRQTHISRKSMLPEYNAEACIWKRLNQIISL